MNEINFFNHLLDETKKVFLESETRKHNPNENWNYAICDTPIQKGKGLFFGLNWGGNDKNAQSAYPDAIKERDWNFINNSRSYFREFFKLEIENLNYSNLCFLRTPNAFKLHPSDWKLTIPLFQEYVEYINPPWTLMLGKPVPLWDHHLEPKSFFLVDDKKNNRKVYGYSGLLFGKYPFGAVPHPQARVSKEARMEIWKKVSKGLIK
jgi:hypothetical protein